MRYRSATLLLLAFPCLAISQSQIPLNFQSYAVTINVAGDKSVVVSSRMGEVAITRSIHAQWHRIDPRPGDELYRPLIDQANFFNRDTGFVSGYIYTSGAGYNIIYRTTDGGHTWDTVDFLQSGWVDHAVNLDSGEAWMSVAGSGIAYTKDFGASWQKITIPDKRQSFSKIFFNPKHEE